MFGTGHTRTHPCFSSVATAGNLPKPVTCAKARVLRSGASGEATIRNGTSALRFLPHVAMCAMFAQGAIRAKNRRPLARSGRTRIHDPSHDKTTIGTGPSAHDHSRLSLYRSWHTLCFFHSSEPVLRRPRDAEGAWHRTPLVTLSRIMLGRRHYAWIVVFTSCLDSASYSLGSRQPTGSGFFSSHTSELFSRYTNSKNGGPHAPSFSPNGTCRRPEGRHLRPVHP